MIQAMKLWLHRAANFVAASLLAAIFVTFLVQIFARYAPNLASLIPVDLLANWMSSIEPIGWTVNLISLLWVWLVFFGCAFVISDRDHVVFDVFLHAMPYKIRRVMRVAVAMIIVFAMIYALAPMWDAVFGNRLMDLKKIQTLRIPFTGDKIAIKWVFAPFILMMCVLIVRYSVVGFYLMRNRDLASSLKEHSE